MARRNRDLLMVQCVNQDNHYTWLGAIGL